MGRKLVDVKDKYKVPEKLRACHTAVVDGYVIEGHVPADLIHKLVKEKPAVLGLAVPGMPMGSPGMETSAPGDQYDVLLFAADGKTKVFARRGGATLSDRAGGSLGRDRKSRPYLRPLHSDAAALPRDPMRTNDD